LRVAGLSSCSSHQRRPRPSAAFRLGDPLGPAGQAPCVRQRRHLRDPLHVLDDEPAGRDVLARHRLGHEAARQAAQLTSSLICMLLTVSTSWPGSRFTV
jgi:hypothetical protein